MASKGGYILLGLLFFLAVLCQLGHSLQCYSCINQVNCTSVVSCSRNQDACLFVKAVPLKFYHQCWKFEECSFELIAKALGEKELHYDCCQKNLCNKSGGMSISEKTPLLLTLLLVAVCGFYL
ncbi:CD59 glycoprotein [Bubalus bubalis]|uniref:CD59 glycoprotein n=1 Tax=Bubalus bubalis TaxID=89462 RepID=UPI00042CB7D7|nr:CD59 glycoprotein [Bubalus bubalis]